MAVRPHVTPGSKRLKSEAAGIEYGKGRTSVLDSKGKSGEGKGPGGKAPMSNGEVPGPHTQV